MKVAIRTNKVSMAVLKKLEAAGIVVTLIFSGVAGSTELQRGDLNKALAEAKADLVRIAWNDADAFDMENMFDNGVVAYMCDGQPELYSNELAATCSKIAKLEASND